MVPLCVPVLQAQSWTPSSDYQAIASISLAWQPALCVEHSEVEEEHWLLWLLSPSAAVPNGDPVSPCSAKILFIFSPLSRRTVGVETLPLDHGGRAG